MPQTYARESESNKDQGVDKEKRTDGSSGGKKQREQEQKAKLRRQQQEVEAKKRRDEVRQNLEKKFKGKKFEQTPFKKAREPMEAGDRVSNERKVVIDIKKYEKFLVEEGGFDPKIVEGWADTDIFLYAQEVLKQRGITEPEESDYKYEKDRPGRKAEEPLIKAQRKRVQSPDEEELTRDKAREYVEVTAEERDKHMEIGKGGGIGAMEAPPRG